MLKFFRRIRRKLIDEGNLKRYLIYAIGEILLVVIGILIALQINNWNESNKETATGNIYLERITRDLAKDTIYLNDKIALAKAEQRSYGEFIPWLYKEQSSTNEFIELISSVSWNADNLIIEDKSYVEITNSGKLSNIKNNKIRNMIMDYYRKYTVVDEHISEMNQTGIRLMSEIYKRIVKYYREVRFLFEKESIVEIHELEYINNPATSEFKELESMAVFFNYKQTVFENYYKELKIDALTLLNEIDSLLEK